MRDQIAKFKGVRQTIINELNSLWQNTLVFGLIAKIITPKFEVGVFLVAGHDRADI